MFRTALIYMPAAWAVFEVSAQLTEVFAWPDWLPKLVGILLAIGFPVAIVLAWVFDLTREGIRRTRGVAIRGAALVTVLVLMGAGSFVTWKLVEPPPVRLDVRCEQTSVPYQAAIAVLPFRVVGAGGDNLQAVAEGLADDIRSLLSRVSGFCVAARASSRVFAVDPDYEDLARRLNITNVVEGSVRQEGGTYRISATLLRPGPSSFNIWSNTYEEDASDLFALQDEVARQVVGGIHASAMAELDAVIDREPKLLGDAYHAYLLARYHFHHWLQDSRSRVYELLERVVTLEPRFPDAWGLLAAASARECANRHCTAEEEQVFRERAEEALREATRLGDSSPKVQAIRCSLLFGEFRDLGGARKAAERALELDINESEAWHCLQELEVTGITDDTSPAEAREAFERALAYAEKAVRLDPYNEPALVAWADLLSLRRDRGEEGLQVLVDGTEVLPDSAVLRTSLGRYLFEDGRLADAAIAHEEAVLLDPTNPWRRLWLGLVYAHLGDRDSLEKLIYDMEQNSGRPFQIADMQFFLAAMDGSLEVFLEDLRRTSPDDIYHAGMSLAFLGRDDEALPILEELSRMPRAPNDLYHEFAMLELASIYIDRNRAEDAMGLLEPIIANYRWALDRGFRANGTNAAVALFLSDQREEAMTVLRREADKEWAGLLMREGSPALQTTMRDPEFRSMEQEMRRRLRAEQQRLDRLHAARERT